MPDIQKADPNAIRVAVAIVASATLLGIVAINVTDGFRSELAAWVRQDVGRRVPMVIAGVTLLTVGPVLGVAGYLWCFGQRMIRTQRYPPEGFRMIRDTPIVTGHSAIRQGRVVTGLAAGIGVAGMLLAIVLWRVFLLL